MNTRNWPIDKIMQLPDWCFGRRYMISCTINTGAGEQTWDISELAFPEKAVIWEMTNEAYALTHLDDYYRLALGDQLPTTAAQMDALEPLFPGMGLQGPEPRHNRLLLYTDATMVKLRMPIQPGGRRMILELTPESESIKLMGVRIIVSSMPTEVPDWLISG